jgi:hypothetical protein
VKLTIPVLVLASACHHPVPDPTYRETCPDPVACACQRLCDLVCVECHPNCKTSIDQVLSTGISNFDVNCVQNAASRQEVRACPMIECP